jgi:hypothetical protein
MEGTVTSSEDYLQIFWNKQFAIVLETVTLSLLGTDQSLMMTVTVPEMEIHSILRWLATQGDLIAYTCHESFRFCIILHRILCMVVNRCDADSTEQVSAVIKH